MPELEPFFGLIGIKGGELTKLFGCVSEVLLAQVRGCQGLTGIAIRRIELQGMLEEGSRFFRGAEFEVIHSQDYGRAEQVGPFAKSLRQVANRQVVFEEALV